MRLILPLLALSLLPLAACDPAGPAVQRYDPVSASAAAIQSADCTAQSYAGLIGAPMDEARASISYAGPIRILGKDDFVTRDYDPHRLTLTTTPKDTVGRIFCG